MAMHLAAFYQSVDPGGALTQINAVTDQAIFTSGKDVRVPHSMTSLIGEAALSAATGPDYAQVQSPTLRDLANQDVNPIQTAAKFATQQGLQWHGSNPRAVTAAESVNFAVKATGGAAAVNYGLIWMGDGATQATTGKVFSIRATSSVTLSAGTWVNGALTFNSSLPSGTYQIVGMYAEGANLVAARLVFIGGTFRPGVPGVTSVADNFFPGFRNGLVGVMGQFDINQPPSVDCLGVTDTAQNYIFDLIRAG